jgi:cellulose biosynthesis protein BcsQ
VICTFYSYKGGVGRSMALAKSADILARAGLRVLMIDFDLEAPGLEQYFEIDQKEMRAHAGLFDLISHYKAAMASSLPAAPQDQDFRKLEELFIAPVYLKLPSAGKLDLMPAGRRGSDEQLSEYALGLRQFDWQDFYFNFGGEVFFEWLRRSLDSKLYDVVLVDSRTGVTEMGGICAYQLADLIVVMCAPNQQNLDGTHDVVRNFFSPRVTMLRSGRPLQLLVIPSRVETRDESLLRDFRDRFEKLFAGFTPKELARHDVAYWDLMIPYDPRSAFQEGVVARDSRAGARSTINPAIQKLVRAIGLLAEPGQPIHKLGAAASAGTEQTEPQYDVTSRAAGYDLFLAYLNEDADAVGRVARSLEDEGLRVFFDRELPAAAAGFHFQQIEHRLQQSSACAVIIGPSGNYPWRSESLRRLLVDRDRSTGLRFVPVLLPGAKLPPSDAVPAFLQGLHWLRLNELDVERPHQLAEAVRANTEQARATTRRASVGPPYKGLAPFEEADAAIFFGRDELINRITRNLEDARFLAVVGSSGSGKTSVVLAGVIPALRRGAIPGSERWHYVVIKPGSNPVRELFDAIATVTPEVVGDDPTPALKQYLDRSDNRYLLVIDQFEDVFSFTDITGAPLDQYFQILLEIVTKWKSRIALIIVMRSDHLNRLLEFAPPWANLVENNLVFVGPMAAADMRKAIEAPAQFTGVAIEPGLTDLILRDATGASGALPLLQYALRALWERRQRGYLTVEAYHAIGGVTGSLASDAEACFAQLPAADRETAMAILLRLVQVTLDGAFVRRIAAFDELTSIGPAEDIRRILHVLAAARLVVVSSDVYFQNARVDLAHEAIIRSWPRLRDQIEGLAQFLRLRTRLEVATQRWQERNKESGFLYPAGEILLLKSQGLLQRYWSELSPAEQGFIAASEYALQRDQRRRLVMALTVWSLFVLMAVAAVFAFLQLLRAQRESASAGAAATRAQEEASRAVTEARLAALANLGAASAISPDGMRMLQINPAGDLSIIDLATGKETGRVAGGSNGITAAAFSADARLVATGTIGGTISIYDSSTLKLLGTSAGHSHAVRRLAFSPAGRLIASGSDDATARIWLVDNWMAVATIAADSPVVGVAFSPDGTRLIVTSQKGSLYIVDAQTGKIVFRNPG